MKIKIIFFAFTLFVVPFFGFAQKNQKEKMSPLRFEHLRINVADKEATAKWYVENVGLEIIPSKSKEFVYVADKDHNFMLELSSIPNLKNTYFDVHLDGFHLAFEGHKSIKTVAEKMLANGGKQEGVLYTNLIGDYVINVRDPNGFDTQLVHRVNPFYSKPVKSPVRFEHFAYNTPDQKITALWMTEFMDLKIPWSKDIDTLKNRYHNYRVPYVGDEGDNMSIELFGKPDVPLTFSKMKHDEVHIAFLCDDPEKLAKRMVYGGAKIITAAITNTNGDIIIDLVDPSNFPIRLIKRKTLILKKSKQ
jgi:catechol 2,3-dioxygenase-like lactoylglutathione lyase family enzyme